MKLFGVEKDKETGRVIKIVDDCKSCDGFCCKYFIVPIKLPSKVMDDYSKWLKHRDGVDVIFHRGKHLMVVHSSCKYVDSDGQCTVFDDEEIRPKMCDVADCPKKDSDYHEKILRSIAQNKEGLYP
jgi:hypothetical protein